MSTKGNYPICTYPDDYSSLLRSETNCMENSSAELFAEINVIPPAKDSESVEGNEDPPECETKDGEKEEELQADKPPKQKKRKTKKKSDTNKENRPVTLIKRIGEFY